MTALINTLVGAATNAVERLTGTLQSKSAGSGAAGEFAHLLANMTGSPAASAAPLAVGRTRELGLGADAAALGTEAAELDAGEESGMSSLVLFTRATATAQVTAGKTRAGNVDAVVAEAVAAEIAPTELEAVEPAIAEAEEAEETGDVNAVDSDLARLQPEFAQRLDRVVERMKEEFGHDVTIVEAHRSQDRQNFLYEQGRTRPGPVVTWTRNSNHTHGRAVDVMIDGTYDNARGYQRLAQIAAEEGLQTLGPRDPGHIELPGSINLASDSRIADALGLKRGDALPYDPQTGIARVARVAEVAQVARVAEVARVAQVAQVGGPGRYAPIESGPMTPASVSTDPGSPVLAELTAKLDAQARAQLADVAAPTPASNATATGNNNIAASLAAASQRGGEGSSGNEGQKGGREGQRQATLSAAEAELFRADPGFGRAFTESSAQGSSFVTGSDAVNRAAQILAMKDGADAGPINHMLLRVDSPDGGQDRIRVDLRGNTVDTTLNIGNARDADQLAARIDDLRQSLERRGLEADAVRVRTTPSPIDRGEGIRTLAAAELDASRSGSQSGNRNGSESGGNSRDPWRNTEEETRREAGNRNRSRREPNKEEKQ